MKPFALLTLVTAVAAISLTSCRKPLSSDSTEPRPTVVIAPELQRNGLEGVPGVVPASQANSPIHWQPWSPQSFKRAKAAKRLVFAMLVMPQYNYERALAAMAADPATVKAIHEHYVPMLIDGDAAREMGILSADLCSEIKEPMQFPLMMWLSYDGNPVAWTPTSSEPAKLLDQFRRSHERVSQIWADDLRMMAKAQEPSYVLKNSSESNASRRKRMIERKVTKIMSREPAADVIRCLRQLGSFYDADARSFDELGGLFPSSLLELLAAAAINPGLPEGIRQRAHKTTSEILNDLLPSAMFDPLDGGVFSARQGESWSLPFFRRNGPNQARIVVALIQAHQATRNPLALRRAMDALAFAERSYRTSDGLFAFGNSDEAAATQWTWSVAEIEKLLSPEDATWWIKATGMRSLGNLPGESDPQRVFFRQNTLALTQTPEEIATALGVDPAGFQARFEGVRKRLLDARNARMQAGPRDDCAHAGATFRMVSAYAAAYVATGDTQLRDKGVELLKRARQAFWVGARLRNFAQKAPDSLNAGRAFIYGLALQAALDIGTISSDDSWQFWTEDLATTAAELFTTREFLKECPDAAKIVDAPVTDLVMLFDDSTMGLISMDECRLAEGGRPLLASFSQLATPLPLFVVARPVLHTDLLLGALLRYYKVTVVHGGDLPAALKLAAERLPLRTILQRRARPDEQVPAGALKVLLPGGDSQLVTSPEALQQAVLPSAGK